MEDYFKKSMELHERIHGKIGVHGKVPVETREDLSVAYSPGVAAPSSEIANHPERAFELTIKGNMVAVVTDGSAVLGLGNIGPLAALPVMEGKSLLFKAFAGVDAFPICLDTQDADEIVETVKRIAPSFGGINLEDIAAPKAFEVESKLQDIGIPVFHDDQHGTAIVLLAALINACKVLDKKLEDLHIVINGAGAAGISIARLLRCVNFDDKICIPAKEVIVCDSKGAIHKGRNDLTDVKKELLSYTNFQNKSGSIKEVLKGMDVFIGVSKGDQINSEDVRNMGDRPIIFAMANPIPEIMPDEALKGGAAIVGTGRSDFPNQVNNVLVFPGIFRGALDARAKKITSKMKLSAVHALANCVQNPSKENILPTTLDRTIAQAVAKAVYEAVE